MASRIEDYAMIGDMRTAALVDREGSIDWFCVPRFDSGACFASLVGNNDNGRWKIAPRHGAKSRRHYRDGSLVLETHFENDEGKVSVVDFMPVDELDSAIVRLVTCHKGKMAMETDLVIRFDYGKSVPWVQRVDNKTVTAIAGPSMLVLQTPVKVHGQDMRTVGKFTVHEGETVPFVLSYVRSHMPPPPPLDVDMALQQTEKFWKGWSKHCTAKGKYSGHIRRSLITLKGLSYRPTGGIVAAPTTSLPEKIGGARNWDYRYCWLRDATFTLLAFINAGFIEEADAWQHWLLRAVAGSPEQLQIMYGVAGERRLDEQELDWLSGFEGSRPVRIGNAAAGQMQLDIYGELADVLQQATRGGLPEVPRRTEFRVAFLEHLEKVWRMPDHGIWEIRGPAQHFVHSKVMAWVAFDRGWRAANAEHLSSKRARWKKIADEIHADICHKGIDPERGCFVQAYGSEALDASLLLLPMVGFLPPSDKRIKATVAEIERHLLRNGLVLRYETASGVDGLDGDEGAFLPCSFWLVDNYVLQKNRKKAVDLFEHLLKCSNDVGLLSEEYDPVAKRMLGNFPQAFTHVALVNSALGLKQDIAAIERAPQTRNEQAEKAAAKKSKTKAKTKTKAKAKTKAKTKKSKKTKR